MFTAADREKWVQSFLTASKANDEETMLTLLKEGKIIAQDLFGESEYSKRPVLEIAAINKNAKVVKYLLEDKNSTLSPDNKTRAMFIASEYSTKEIVSIFLENGIDLNVKNQYNYTPLLAAARYNNKEVVKFLLEKGADINAQDIVCDTALHIASKQGHKEIAVMLIEKGTDINAKNENGKTPLDLAHGETRKFMKQAAEYNSKKIHDKLKTALDAAKETEEVKKTIKEVVANPYFKDLGDLRKHRNIERLYAPLKEYAKAHPDDKAKNKMAARVEGTVYGRVSQTHVSYTLDRLYDDMYRESKHNKDKKVPPQKQAELRANAGQSMASTMNDLLTTNNLIMGVKIEYNKETKKLEAKYEENPKLFQSASIYNRSVSIEHPTYWALQGRDIDALIAGYQNDAGKRNRYNEYWPKAEVDQRIAQLQKLKENIQKAGPIFEKQKEGIQANLDKMNKALDDSVQDAVKKAENPETHKSMKRKKVGLICGMVASVAVGVALMASGIGSLVGIAGGLGLGLYLGGTLVGMTSVTGGIVGFVHALEGLGNRAGKEEAIKFGREASEICNDLVSTFKEMDKEVKAAPAPEKKEAVGKFTAAVTGTTTEPQVEMPDTKPMEELISGMAKQLKALTKEVAEARKDAAAARQEATEARREVDDAKSNMLGGAAKVTNLLRQSMYQLETAASAARTLREPAREATVTRQ